MPVAPNLPFPPSTLHCLPQTHTSLHDLLLLWTRMCSEISFLICSLSSGQFPEYFLLLLKLTICQFPSPPNHLIHIPSLGLLSFNFICSVTQALFTLSVSLILHLWHSWPKWSFSASRQEPQRNSSPKWCDKPEKCIFTHSNICTYFYVCKH